MSSSQHITPYSTSRSRNSRRVVQLVGFIFDAETLGDTWSCQWLGFFGSKTTLIRTEDQEEHFSLIIVRVDRMKAVELSAHREKMELFRKGRHIGRILVEKWVARSGNRNARHQLLRFYLLFSFIENRFFSHILYLDYGFPFHYSSPSGSIPFLSLIKKSF